METVKRNPEAENRGTRPVDREAFRAWFAGYRRDLKMSQQTSQFAAQWWRDLAPALRAFIVGESGVSSDVAMRAVRGEFGALSDDDQGRLLVVARDLIRDLKPVTWMG